MSWCRRLCMCALAVALVLSARAGMTQGMITHGANSIAMIGPGLRLAWTIRRGANEAETLVVIRVVATEGLFHFIRVDGADPFSKVEKVLVATRALDHEADLVIPRAQFADYPSTAFQFFKSGEDAAANKPALTVFYLGVPDTTPEFADQAAAEAYLDRMLKP